VNGKRCLICRGSGTCPVCGRAFDVTAAPAPTIEESVRFVPLAATATLQRVSSVETPVTVARWSNAKLTSRAVLALLILVAFYVLVIAAAA
jgi:hypothetical protein